MKRIFNLKLSLLGIVLGMTSVVTAAVIKTNYKGLSQGNDDGSLRISSFGLQEYVFTCLTDEDGNVACTASSNGGITTTTGEGEADSYDEDGKQTIGNTSITNSAPGDQSSVVE